MFEQTPERPRAASEDEAGGCSPIPWPPAADAQGPQFHPSSGGKRLHRSCLGTESCVSFCLLLVGDISKSVPFDGDCKHSEPGTVLLTLKIRRIIRTVTYCSLDSCHLIGA